MMRSVRLMGRVQKTAGSPRDSSSARLRFSSIIGPSTKPSSSGAGSTSAYAQMMNSDPEMGYRALGAQWENLKISLGKTLVPVLIPFLRGMTNALNSAATFAARHPTLTQGLMLTFTTLSMLATLGGGLMVGAAVVEWVLGVDAERRSLEEVAPPLSAA